MLARPEVLKAVRGLVSGPVTGRVGNRPALSVGLLVGLLVFGSGVARPARPDQLEVTVESTPLMMHVGEQVPPLLYAVKGYPGHGTYTDAIQGSPSLSLTAGRPNQAGVYPIHISAGSMRSASYRLRFRDASLTVLPADAIGAKLATTVPHPSGFMPSVRSMGVRGDGVTDDTEAINTIFRSARQYVAGGYYGDPLLLYFPKGIYLVCGTVQIRGNAVTLEGDGPDQTIFKVPRNCPAFNTAHTQPVFSFPSVSSNQNFRNFVFHLGIHVEAGNPQAIALDYVGNNAAAIEDVNIWSDDSLGDSGISMLRAYTGPALLKNVAVYGFKRGIQAGQIEYGFAAEGITLEGQTDAAISNDLMSFSLRHLLSANQVPSLVTGNGVDVILDSALFGHDASAPAIKETKDGGGLLLSRVLVRGYGVALRDPAGRPQLGPGQIRAYNSKSQQRDTASAPSLDDQFPPRDTPVPQDSAPEAWTKLGPDIAHWGAQLASSRASTAYCPARVYRGRDVQTVYNVVVPPFVRHIICYDAIVEPDASVVNFIVNGDSPEPVIIERFSINATVTQNGSRPIVLRHMLLRNYVSRPGSGDVFLEDIQVFSPVTFFPGQHVWARQIDLEQAGPKLTCKGCSLWALFYKTENFGPSLVAEPGSHVNILGGLFYPVFPHQPPDSVLVELRDASVSLTFRELVYEHDQEGMGVMVKDTRNGHSERVAPANQDTIFDLIAYTSPEGPADQTKLPRTGIPDGLRKGPGRRP